MSDDGMIKGAPATAPGGMSLPAIKVELVEKHGWTMPRLRDEKWPDLIQLLIKERRNRELEKPTQPVKTQPKPVVTPEPVAEDEDEDEFADLDNLDDDEASVWDPATGSYVDEDEAEAEAEAEPVAEDESEPETESEPEPVLNLDDLYITLTPEDHDQVSWTEADFDALDSDTVTDTVADEADDDVAALLDEVAAAQPLPLFIGLPQVRDYIFDGHAGAGPSGAERWMNCTSSLGAVREFLETLSPNQQVQFASANTAARQGTTAHAIAESEVNVLLGVTTVEEHNNVVLDLTLSPPNGETYDEEMAEYLTEYTDYVQTFIDAGHEVHAEQRVEALIPLTVEGVYTHVYEDGDTLPDYYSIRGSADLTVYPMTKYMRLTVGDLKYGQGIDVDVEQNPQIRIYALGVLAMWMADGGDINALEGVDYAIVQPRMGGLKTWTESIDDLLTWRDEVLSPALTAALGFAPSSFAPSDLACEWCPVRGRCPALTAQRVEAAADLFDAVMEAEFDGHDIGQGLPDNSVLDGARLGKLLKQVEGLVGLRDDLKEEAQRRLHRGEGVSGYQLVNYTPARYWKEGADKDKTLAKLPVWKPQTLLTPTQAIKVLGDQASQIESLIEKPDIRPVVAPEGDRRKTWTGKPPEQMFPDEVTDD